MKIHLNHEHRKLDLIAKDDNDHKILCALSNYFGCKIYHHIQEDAYFIKCDDIEIAKYLVGDKYKIVGV